MQMTESYAATVAAVVPVLWLVGVVEQHQLAKAFAQRSRELQDMVADHRRTIAAVGEGATVAQLQAAMESLKLAPPDRDAKIKNFASAAWAIAIGVLLPAEAAALTWLADPSRGPQELWATYCWWATMTGFLAVGSVPLVMALWTDRQATRGMRADTMEIRELRRQLLRDFENRITY
ncbi:hypothetical protein GCM10009837_83330 [Streptomyces durmitorensis]|uniref:Uncharacterized protein n=1 Tax=Streptomyces durmitorensis TaxID=319947 RepID=A0ABY4PZH3_9ACTN|nr:hypothetical protein [Streptomyces durmitorensis]UQT59206.1 hypothetical protein M4V62_31370 [Streptomyces durmitorensis]